MDLTPVEARIRHGDHEELVAVDARADRRRDDRPARREDSARRRGRGRPLRRQSGADHRRIAAGRQGPGRRSLRRHHQRARGARSRGDPPAARHDAGTHHPSGRDGAGAARARRSSSSIASRAGTRPRLSSWPSLVAAVPPLFGGAFDIVALSRAGPARGLVPVRAGDLDAGVDRFRARRRGAPRRAHQRRRAPGAAGGDPRDRLRQDRHADARVAARDVVHAGRRRRPRRSCSRRPPPSRRAPNTRSRPRSPRRPRARHLRVGRG